MKLIKYLVSQNFGFIFLSGVIWYMRQPFSWKSFLVLLAVGQVENFVLKMCNRRTYAKRFKIGTTVMFDGQRLKISAVLMTDSGQLVYCVSAQNGDTVLVVDNEVKLPEGIAI